MDWALYGLPTPPEQPGGIAMVTTQAMAQIRLAFGATPGPFYGMFLTSLRETVKRDRKAKAEQKALAEDLADNTAYASRPILVLQGLTVEDLQNGWTPPA